MIRSKAQGYAYSRQAQQSSAHPSPAERPDSNQAVFAAASAASAAAATTALVTAHADHDVQPARVVMTLDHDYDEVYRHGKNRYSEELRSDLARALRIPHGRIEVLELSRGSVKATIALLHDSRSGPALLELVRELQRQLAEPSSVLRQGNVTSRVLSIQSIALPGMIMGSSRVSEVGEDFVEEPGSIHFAQNLVNHGQVSAAAPVTPPEVNQVLLFTLKLGLC